MEEYERFISLVKEFLPEREQDILRQVTPSSQVAAFASYFEDRYFPLDDRFKLGDVEGYSELIYGIPVVVYGLTWEDYHEIPSDWREGFQLMTYLIESPYEDDARIALAEACAEYVSQELLQRVPEEGFSPAELHQLVDNTRYSALAIWADMVWSQTGNFFLDVDFETLWSEGQPEWDMGTVQEVITRWQQAEAMQNKMVELAQWLEKDLPAHFAEMLNFILERRLNG
jgi:hypothetical protein